MGGDQHLGAIADKRAIVAAALLDSSSGCACTAISRTCFWQQRPPSFKPSVRQHPFTWMTSPFYGVGADLPFDSSAQVTDASLASERLTPEDRPRSRGLDVLRSTKECP